MKKRVSLVLAAVLALSAFVSVAQASAATEFGSGCTATEGESGPTSFISVSHGPGSPLPVAAPVSGVITEWKTSIAVGEAPPEVAEFLGPLYRQKLLVVQPIGSGAYTMVGESIGGTMNLNGTSSFPARIPVQAGDLLGLGGTGITLLCENTGSTADQSAIGLGAPPVGSKLLTLENVSELQVPVIAKIEPDVDGDGYGDETQDKCPQSAAYQTACPVVTISSKPFVAGKKAVTLYVSTSLSAPVGVTGTVNLGKGKKATLTAAAQTVAPGSLTPFKLTLSKQVTKALAETSTKKSLTLSITASATNVTGAPSTSTSSVKLKGQAKPAAKKHKKSNK
jgi:hypothetical protein